MKKYMPFFRVGMIEEMAYRAGLLAWVLITFLQLICVVFLWISVYKNAVSDVINGFTRYKYRNQRWNDCNFVYKTNFIQIKIFI